MARVRKKTIGRREHNKIVSMKGSSSFSSSEEEDFELRNLLLDGNQCLYENAEISNKALKVLENNWRNSYLGHTVCMTCATGREEDLYACDICQRVGYCSLRCYKQDADNHAKYCKFLNRAFDDYESLPKDKAKRVHKRLQKLLLRRNDCKLEKEEEEDGGDKELIINDRRIPKASNNNNNNNNNNNLWRSFGTLQRPYTMRTFFELFLPRISLYSEYGVLLSMFLSYPLTILANICRFDCYKLAESSYRAPYTIHVVGASYHESFSMAIWEIFAFLLRVKYPRCHLRICLVGPELQDHHYTFQQKNKKKKERRMPPSSSSYSVREVYNSQDNKSGSKTSSNVLQVVSFPGTYRDLRARKQPDHPHQKKNNNRKKKTINNNADNNLNNGHKNKNQEVNSNSSNDQDDDNSSSTTGTTKDEEEEKRNDDEDDDDDDDDDSNFVETDNDFGDNEEGENNLSLHRKRKLIKEKDLLREMALQPDLIVLFHPGVSDDSYDWIEELKIIKNDLSSKGHKGSSTQLLVTTGSRAEMIMEIDTIGQALNLNFTQMISGNDISFNPCSSHMLLQSGTIANELYRKNAWCVRICPARQI
mmetsp:Transcript_1160/g.1788  ORF Transcript_1160/g.1788 Transcript_1160/m.1788 type:complete len:590 (-) Transcript_1160:169-1938(-)